MIVWVCLMMFDLDGCCYCCLILIAAYFLFVWVRCCLFRLVFTWSVLGCDWLFEFSGGWIFNSVALLCVFLLFGLCYSYVLSIWVCLLLFVTMISFVLFACVIWVLYLVVIVWCFITFYIGLLRLRFWVMLVLLIWDVLMWFDFACICLDLMVVFPVCLLVIWNVIVSGCYLTLVFVYCLFVFVV